MKCDIHKQDIWRKSIPIIALSVIMADSERLKHYILQYYSYYFYYEVLVEL